MTLMPEALLASKADKAGENPRRKMEGNVSAQPRKKGRNKNRKFQNKTIAQKKDDHFPAFFFKNSHSFYKKER